MITQYWRGTGWDCDYWSTIDFLWLVQILDGERAEVFKDMLVSYSWHSVSPSRGKKVVLVV